ncbi:hypothetical protein GeomeDRAFT_1277 [Geobacter metallireducens RCH3]|nr:hypothetical protein GeomeDRAFT_1277 [Geobacter metallireducens RCH3]
MFRKEAVAEPQIAAGCDYLAALESFGVRFMVSQ